MRYVRAIRLLLAMSPASAMAANDVPKVSDEQMACAAAVKKEPRKAQRCAFGCTLGQSGGPANDPAQCEPDQKQQACNQVEGPRYIDIGHWISCSLDDVIVITGL